MRVLQYLTTEWAVGMGVLGVFAGLVFAYGLTTLLNTTPEASMPPPMGIAATIFGFLALLAYIVWLLVFFKHHRERPIPDGAEPVELIEE